VPASRTKWCAIWRRAQNCWSAGTFVKGQRGRLEKAANNPTSATQIPFFISRSISRGFNSAPLLTAPHLCTHWVSERERKGERAQRRRRRCLLIRLMCRPKGITCRSGRTVFLVSPIFGALPAGIKSLTDDCVIESNYKTPSVIAERENRSQGSTDLLGRQHKLATLYMYIDLTKQHYDMG